MSEVHLLWRGALSELPERIETVLMRREPRDDPGHGAAVAAIVTNVRSRGDTALLEMAERLDGASLERLEVPRERWTRALDGLDRKVRAALERAAGNIHRFHEALVPGDVTVDVGSGVRITKLWVPLDRVGVYAPGGSAAYPSSVLMGVVPARAAGVGEVVLCSPPGASGLPSETVLAAAEIAGADRLFACGGAGAIAALAYGTHSVPAVDAIVGPGNRWVTEAKRQVAGHVTIDSPAGPSEVLVLADEHTDPRLAAHELLAQAEHDADAACVLVSTSGPVADAVEAELGELVAETPRAEVVRQALLGAGASIRAASLDAAIDFANRYAPEHASVLTADALADARRIRTAGTVFVGPAASVAFGDYMTGANHVLPTAGRARSFSGLTTHHYMRAFTLQEIDGAGALAMADDVALLAEAEGLPAHAAAVRARASS